MKFLPLLQKGHSKKTTDIIVNEVNIDHRKINELMDCFFSDEMRICQRAAWPVGILGKKQGHLFIKFIPKMIKAASENPLHDAITRNVVRVFQYMEIPEKDEGAVYNFCYNNIINLSQPIAVRAFSIKVCTHMAKKHPELINEISELLEVLQPDESPAIKSVVKYSKKLLKI